jgi:hypothetical protein
VAPGTDSKKGIIMAREVRRARFGVERLEGRELLSALGGSGSARPVDTADLRPGVIVTVGDPDDRPGTGTFVAIGEPELQPPPDGDIVAIIGRNGLVAIGDPEDRR